MREYSGTVSPLSWIHVSWGSMPYPLLGLQPRHSSCEGSYCWRLHGRSPQPVQLFVRLKYYLCTIWKVLTLGSMAAARGRKKVGDSVWVFTRCSIGGVEPVKWPSRPDRRDFEPDILHRECRFMEKGLLNRRAMCDIDEWRGNDWNYTGNIVESGNEIPQEFPKLGKMRGYRSNLGYARGYSGISGLEMVWSTLYPRLQWITYYGLVCRLWLCGDKTGGTDPEGIILNFGWITLIHLTQVSLVS